MSSVQSVVLIKSVIRAIRCFNKIREIREIRGFNKIREIREIRGFKIRVIRAICGQQIIRIPAIRCFN